VSLLFALGLVFAPLLLALGPLVASLGLVGRVLRFPLLVSLVNFLAAHLSGRHVTGRGRRRRGGRRSRRRRGRRITAPSHGRRRRLGRRRRWGPRRWRRRSRRIARRRVHVDHASPEPERL